MIPSLLAVAAAALAGVGSAHPYLGPGRPVARRDDWLPEPKGDDDDEPVPLAPAYGYGLASLNGGRTVEEVRRDLAEGRERAKVRHRCRWCRGVCTGPMDPSPVDGPFDLPPVFLEPEEGPYLWCDRCCMWLDANEWQACDRQVDAERKRRVRAWRNLWRVRRGGLVAHG